MPDAECWLNAYPHGDKASHRRFILFARFLEAPVPPILAAALMPDLPRFPPVVPVLRC